MRSIKHWQYNIIIIIFNYFKNKVNFVGTAFAKGVEKEEGQTLIILERI